ncbi:Methyltransferase-like protein [Quillaja saponaria]|uniref:Methyltransferase-like protein n=1 Tax=Quillaja saponaria TaxID=32244 RepID=A0AAD7L6H9_QUISA|nr:Methyltransferase-like protein [Quillaja saponaria]
MRGFSISPCYSYLQPTNASIITGRGNYCRALNEHYYNNADKYWNNFYKRHQNKFFKDRHYLDKDWGCFFSSDEDSSNGKVLLEVGCGSGNTIFPLMAAHPKLYIHACDISLRAITLVKLNGYILFRDYAFGDFSQVKLQEKKRKIGEDCYVRGDGTCSFYFSEDFLSSLFSRAGFKAVTIDIYGKQIENCSLNIIMDRLWIHAIFSNFNCTCNGAAPGSVLISEG